MKPNSCNICGSNQLIADRALAGKIVCRNCGNPVNIYIHKPFKSNTNLLSSRSFLYFLLSILVIIIVINFSS